MSQVSLLPRHIAAAHARTLKAITDGILFPPAPAGASARIPTAGATPFPRWSDLTMDEQLVLELRYDGPIPDQAIADTIRLRGSPKPAPTPLRPHERAALAKTCTKHAAGCRENATRMAARLERLRALSPAPLNLIDRLQGQLATEIADAEFYEENAAGYGQPAMAAE